MTNTNEPKEVLGIFVQKNEVSNLNMETIHVTDYAIQTILKTIRLNPEVQEEVIDKMVDRTPDYFNLSPEEQTNKIKTTLTIETVIEYLRLEGYIREGIDMVEVGIDEEGSLVVQAYYVAKTELTEKVFKEQMTEEQMEEYERQINILDGSMNIYEEAKKKLEQMKKDNVIPFPNREARRRAKHKRGVRS